MRAIFLSVVGGREQAPSVYCSLNAILIETDAERA
jgi:hypothetical protein